MGRSPSTRATSSAASRSPRPANIWTAHVNFSALARAGCEQGIAVAGYTTQGTFLRRLGVVEAARMLGQRFYPAADSERQSDHGQAALLRRRMLESTAATLLDPRGLGGFRVLVQQRGVPNAGHLLTGLAVDQPVWTGRSAERPVRDAGI